MTTAHSNKKINSKKKGNRFERLVAKDMRAIFGSGVKRGWQARLGSDEADVDGTPWWIECKHRIKPSWRAAYEQAKKESDGRPPLAVCRDNGGKTVVIMDYKEFIRIIGGE